MIHKKLMQWGDKLRFIFKYKRKEKLKYQQSVGIVLREVLLELDRGARQNEV